MGRPKGMKKVNGVWFLPNGTVAPSSAAKVQNNGGATVTLTPPAIKSEKSVQAATEAITEIATRSMVQGISLYTPDQIKALEVSTGLVFVGNFANSEGDKYSGELVPVFLRADHTDEKRKEDLTRIRKGI